MHTYPLRAPTDARTTPVGLWLTEMVDRIRHIPAAMLAVIAVVTSLFAFTGTAVIEQTMSAISPEIAVATIPMAVAAIVAAPLAEASAFAVMAIVLTSVLVLTALTYALVVQHRRRTQMMHLVTDANSTSGFDDTGQLDATFAAIIDGFDDTGGDATNFMRRRHPNDGIMTMRMDGTLDPLADGGMDSNMRPGDETHGSRSGHRELIAA